MITIGGEIGNIVKDGVLQSRQFIVTCDNHPNPIEMKRGAVTQKDKTITYDYLCPKCFQSISEDEVNDAYNWRKNQDTLGRLATIKE